MNPGVVIGALGSLALVYWTALHYGSAALFSNLAALGFVTGGTALACLVGFPLPRLRSALSRSLGLLWPSPFPTEEEVIEQILRLARVAQTEGGLMALADQAGDFADQFLARGVLAAISTGEANETRRVLEREIRRRRHAAQEDANLVRTAGVLAPMFGLLGTLLGMMRVMTLIGDASKAGAAMALSLASAFYGISLANVVCVPIAGHIRLRAIDELVALDTLLEGVLDLLASRPPAYVAMHLRGYAQARREAAQTEREPVAA